MTDFKLWSIAALVSALALPVAAQAPVEPSADAPGQTETGALAAPVAPADSPLASAAPIIETLSLEATSLRAKAEALPEGTSDEERNERVALIAFYERRSFEPLWTRADGLSDNAKAALVEMAKAGDWGLDAKVLAAPDAAIALASPDARAGAELAVSRAILLYARFARGGRIVAPPEQLNSHLDRRPQFIRPADILNGAAQSADVAAYLRGVHPQHPQFDRLRDKYLAAPANGREAKRLLANMEMWRWMPTDMGDLHVFANVPEFMLRLVKKGEVIHSERIVAGMLDKQTTIFSRPLRHIVFRPMWRVPESIMVKELWPSLRGSGGLMREHGLEVVAKDGTKRDWRTMDWTKEDIRNYDVTQPPGRNSALGVVKFSFPSQHTIYMHDTPDKWMFNAARRTLSHGCLRVRNPVKLAELILAEDKGWDRAKIDDLIKSGPLNNEVALDSRVRVHLTYFTAWVDDAGALKTYPDVYGHEKRVTQALDGKWTQIAKGGDHLAPPKPNFSSRRESTARKGSKDQSVGDLMNRSLGGFF